MIYFAIKILFGKCGAWTSVGQHLGGRKCETLIHIKRPISGRRFLSEYIHLEGLQTFQGSYHLGKHFVPQFIIVLMNCKLIQICSIIVNVNTKGVKFFILSYFLIWLNLWGEKKTILQQIVINISKFMNELLYFY